MRWSNRVGAKGKRRKSEILALLRVTWLFCPAAHRITAHSPMLCGSLGRRWHAPKVFSGATSAAVLDNPISVATVATTAAVRMGKTGVAKTRSAVSRVLYGAMIAVFQEGARFAAAMTTTGVVLAAPTCAARLRAKELLDHITALFAASMQRQSFAAQMDSMDDALSMALGNALTHPPAMTTATP